MLFLEHNSFAYDWSTVSFQVCKVRNSTDFVCPTPDLTAIQKFSKQKTTISCSFPMKYHNFQDDPKVVLQLCIMIFLSQNIFCQYFLLLCKCFIINVEDTLSSQPWGYWNYHPVYTGWSWNQCNGQSQGGGTSKTRDQKGRCVFHPPSTMQWQIHFY